jgi:hypothetical protein
MTVGPLTTSNRRWRPCPPPLVGRAEQHDATKAGVAADAHDAGVGDDVKHHRPQEMRALIDRAHRSIAIPGLRAGDEEMKRGPEEKQTAVDH